MANNTYEMMVALKSLLPDEVRRAMHKAIVGLASDLGGEVIDVDVWGKRYLAYEIDGHSEGYYILYQMELPAQAVKELNRQLRLKQEILRFLVTKIEDPSSLSSGLKKKAFKDDIDASLNESEINFDDPEEEVEEGAEAAEATTEESTEEVKE